MSIIKCCSFVLVAALLSGCGQDSGEPVAVTKDSVVDLLAPRYEASLAEGIDFKKLGYPSFLLQVSGMSGTEGFGSWTVGPVAKFRFKQALPGKFTLLITAGALGPNLGKPIVVRVGKLEREFTVKEASASVYTLNFEGVDGTDTIEIFPPQPIRPKDIDLKSEDVRLLGVAMVSLKIQ